MIVPPGSPRRRLREVAMARARRHGIRSARRGATIAAVVALAVLAAAPAAADDAGRGAAAAPVGTDVTGLAFDAAGRLYAADARGDRVVVLGPGDEVLG